ncbi:MAG: glycosyltransferase [Candidatus Wallbacteria bacterium]|nr:glycosyltransferase [Candidatus Wallbacteria bacterium]
MTRASVEPIRVMFAVSRLQRGGLEQVLLDIATGLAPRGFEFEIVALQGEGARDAEFRSAGVPVTLLAGRPNARAVLANLGCLAALARTLRSRRPHILQSHHFFSGVLGRVAGRLGGVGALLQADHNFYLWKGPAARAADRLLAAFTDAFVTPSQAVADHVARTHGVDAGRIQVVPNGVAAPPVLASRAAARERLGLPADVPVVGFVGRLAPPKRPESFLRVFAEVAASDQRPVAAILGGGPLEGACRARARALDTRVRFAGEVPAAAALMAAFDVVVSTSSEEGFGLGVAEAILAGVPVVVPPLAVFRELLPAWPERFFATEETAARAVLELLREPAPALEAAARSRRHLLEARSPKAMLDAYERLYRGLVSSAARTPRPDRAGARA